MVMDYLLARQTRLHGCMCRWMDWARGGEIDANVDAYANTTILTPPHPHHTLTPPHPHHNTTPTYAHPTLSSHHHTLTTSSPHHTLTTSSPSDTIPQDAEATQRQQEAQIADLQEQALAACHCRCSHDCNGRQHRHHSHHCLPQLRDYRIHVKTRKQYNLDDKDLEV